MEGDNVFTIVQNLSNGKVATIRRAIKEDAYKIQELYFLVYNGRYPLSLINDIHELNAALTGDDFVWVLIFIEDKLIGSVIYEIDHEQRIAKSFGAVIITEFRGHNLTGIAMKHVQDMILGKDKMCDIIYATTRTESSAPQKLTEKLGYKKLGLFPNVRKVVDYETHCLTAIFDDYAFETRKKPPVILPELKDIYEITRAELKLEHATIEDYIDEDENTDKELIEFEVISAENYVKRRFKYGIEKKIISMHFFPFQKPNLLLCSKDLTVEIYLYHALEDNHSCIIGGRFEDYDYHLILESVCATAKLLGIRYLELLVGAYKPKTLREVLNARFLPSAYFPALKLVTEEDNPFLKKGERLDHFVFSRSFEMLDFKDIKLEGIYKKYLKNYFIMWKRLYIDGVFED